jgi:type I restriction enzyme S subunit
MSLDRLLSQFDALAEHGTNIAKIRKLLIINVIKRSISRDGFLQRAATAKAQIALTSQKTGGKNSKTRNQDLALPDVLLKIPAEAFGRLGDIAEIEKGLTAIQKSKPGPYPLVVTAETRSSNETFDFEGPAVVIPMVSSTGHGHASLKRIHYQEGKFAAGNILSVVKPKLPDLLNTRFLYEYLTAFKEELLVARMVGTANVSLTINGLRDIPVPLIQGEDVAKVDELMALCDRLEAQLKERDVKQAALAKAALAKFTEDPTPENLQLLFHPSFSIEPEDLRKMAISLAIKGRLVPQDPNDESAATSCGLDTATTGISLAELPHGWIWTNLDTLSEINGGFAFKSTDYTEEGIRVVRISDFNEFGFQDHKVVRHPFSAEFQRFTLEEKNILVAMTGGTVGKSYFVRFLPEPMVVNQRVATIKVSGSVSPNYIDIVLRSEMTQEVIRKVKNSTNDNISMSDIKGLRIPLPPLAEQIRIVKKVDQLVALVNTLEAQLEASRMTGEKLLEAMVAELTAA